MPAPPQTPPPLREYLQKSYLELFEIALKIELSCEEIQNQSRALDKGRTFASRGSKITPNSTESRLKLHRTQTA